MALPGDTAVLVLAAGPGTRMRSDTPKVLHTIAGRSMLSHSLHAIAKVAPQHLVVVLGHEHQRIAPLVAQLAEHLGRTIDVALQDSPRGTGDAVRCGLSALPAGLRRHRRRHLGRHPAAGLRHPGRAGRGAQRKVGGGDGADHHAAPIPAATAASCAPRTTR